MRHTLLISTSAMSLLALMAVPSKIFAQEQQSTVQSSRYVVTDLGTLGGTSSIAFGVNYAGGVAGSSNLTTGGPQHAFLGHGGNLKDLGTLGGLNSIGDGPNARDEVAIYSETADSAYMGEDFCGFGNHHQCLAAIWREGKLTALPTLPGGNNAQALALNNRGQVIGFAETGKLEEPGYCATPNQILDFEAVIWGPKPGEIQELPPLPGDTVGFAGATNDRGQVVGTSGLCSNTTTNGLVVGPHAVLWDSDGSVTDLGNLGGTMINLAASINIRGEVVGGSQSKDGNIHAFLWTKDTGMQDLGLLGKDTLTAPTWINNHGQVVGGSCPGPTGNCRAFLWQDKTLLDLNTLIPADGPLYLLFAWGINESGEIVGQAMTKSGEFHAFKAIPCDSYHATAEECKTVAALQ
jgi:probable HAF family extracellular repeat protein